MAHMQPIIENPLSGERCRWHLRSRDTGGRLVRAEWWARPGGGVGFTHVHARAEERFEVLSGELTVELDGVVSVLGPGERATLPPGIPHRWWNAGEREVHFFVELDPPGHFEETIETLFGLAREGRLGRNGLPDLLQLAVMTRAYGLEAYPTSPPRSVLRALAALLAPVGRLLGRRPTYERFSQPAASA